jgi:transcriptional regulator with XRE-family HTH domain
MPTTLNTGRLDQLITQKYGSRAAFAKACGMSRQYMNELLNGKHDPSLERIVFFADLLGVSVDELVIRGSRD